MTPGVFSTTTLLDRIALQQEEQAALWNQTTWMVVLIGCAALGFALYRRTPLAVSYLLASAALFGTVVLAFSLVGNYLLPLPHRYVMELNVALVLVITWLTTIRKRWGIALVAASVQIGRAHV